MVRVKSHRLCTSAVLARSAALAVIACVALVLSSARPQRFEISITDVQGRPLEAVRVRVVRSGDRSQAIDLYTDVHGRAATELSGVHKRLDVEINGVPGQYRPTIDLCGASAAGALGPNYESRWLCGLDAAAWARTQPSVMLAARLPTATVCRLTGAGSATEPYSYGGQDSAITIPMLGGESEQLLWWFGDTVEDVDGWILVQNKLATSAAALQDSRCPRLTYEGEYARAALPVAADGVPMAFDADSVGPPAKRRLANGRFVEAEDTVWLDLPLVVPGSAGYVSDERFGQPVFRPSAGDVLHVVYLSVRDMPELFRINHIGIATYRSCFPCCWLPPLADARFMRRPTPLWFGPTERARAPEGNALIDGDDYLIMKVQSRRSYCEEPPHAVDCSAERRCDDGGRCLEPGKFCSLEPYTRCSVDAECERGRCVAGGVVVMRVARSRVLDKSAYLYWDARSESFSADPDRDPDAVLVDADIGNSVSIMWSTYLGRWIMISNRERAYFAGQSEVVARTAPSPMGPWGEPLTIMENLADQRSYNPRFVPGYTKGPPADNLVYWTATYATYGASEPTHAMPFDYNVFLYETDLAILRRMID